MLSSARTFEVRRHGIPGIYRQIDDDLLELADVGLDRPEVAHLRHIERHVLSDQSAEQHCQVRECLTQIDHLRSHRLLA